jgi:drug/metabolite transporter (DMT)-like permease
MQLSVLLLLVSVVLVSLNPIWIQKALWGGASPLALTFWQAFFAVLFYGLVVARRFRSVLPGRRPAIRFLLTGCAFFLMALSFSLSQQRLSASFTVMIFFSYPLFVLTGNALIFRERLSRPAVLALLLVFSGVLVTTWPSGRPESMAGIILALVAALSHAVFITATGRHTRSASPLQVSVWAQLGFLASSLLLIPWLPVTVLFQPAGILFGLILAFLSSLLGFLLFVKGIEGLGANRASLITVLNLPLSLLFARIFLGETAGPRLIAGLALILGGLLLESLSTAFLNNGRDHDR